MTQFCVGIFVSLFLFCFTIFGQNNTLTNLNEAKNTVVFSTSNPQSAKDSQALTANSYAAFPNPILIDSQQGCQFGNLNINRFDTRISTNQRVEFCEALQAISVKLNSNWSPALKSELQQIWHVFMTQNVKIRPMKEGVSSRIIAGAEAFTERGIGFNASFYLRPEKSRDKSFFLVFMHELRHIYDFYSLYKSQTSITELELEKRGFRIMGKIYQEMPNKERFFRMPTFWDNDWKKLSETEIAQKREEKIEKFMRGNPFYENLLKNPEQYPISFSQNQSVMLNAEFNPLEDDEENKGEKLPTRMNIRQSQSQIEQRVKELSFTVEKAKDAKNPDELLRAALINEKNLYHKMDNFVYDQSLQLQCWKKQQVTENYELNRLVARTNNGETLFQKESAPLKNAKNPECVQNIDSIKTDATETFWSAPYLDQMPIKFEYLTEIDGIKVARYTVLQPTLQKFNQIAAQYPNIKQFRAFIGTIFVSIEDSQIIKFWGTSFPESEVTGNQKGKTYASYCATAIRQKLASGVWVTTLLNTVAVTNDKNKMKPFSYVVKYQNYRQGDSDVKIIDDEQVASNN